MRNGQRELLPQNDGFNMARMYKYTSTPLAQLKPEELNRYDEQGRNLPDGVADPAKASYSQDLIHAEALRFIRDHQRNPFFLFNVTNTANFRLPVRQIDAVNAGRITASDDGRKMQFALKYLF
jgi:hypothetical protein